MMKRQQLHKVALEEISRRRQANETAAMQQRQELLAAEPGLARLETEITTAGIEAATLALNGNRQRADQQLARVQALHEQLRALLVQLGLSPDALDVKYSCPLCKDTGWHKGRMCQCVRQEACRLRRAEINQTGPLRLCRFENFDLERYPRRMEANGQTVQPRAIMEGILRDCRDWAADFGPNSPSIIMYGDAGLGKTHLALSIASEVLEKGWDVIYVSAQRAFATIESGEDGGEMFEAMRQADLLVLDDLGVEFLNARVLSRLYDLINTRMNWRPTIYTTNICSQKLLEQRYDEKIASRLLGECHRMRFWGEDVRLQ